MYRIELSKETLKFSCTHFTIFGQNHGERMHGHNYRLRVGVSFAETDPELGLGFDFNLLKPHLKHLCDELDEAILIPNHSPYLKITQAKGEVTVVFGKKKYLLPEEDVRLLPIANVTVEALAHLLHDRIGKYLNQAWKISLLDVSVEETSGQRASYQAAPKLQN